MNSKENCQGYINIESGPLTRFNSDYNLSTQSTKHRQQSLFSFNDDSTEHTEIDNQVM